MLQPQGRTGCEVRGENGVIISVQALEAVAAGHTARLSGHVLALSPSGRQPALSFCPAHRAVMLQWSLHGDQEETPAEVLGCDGSWDECGEGMI